MLKNKFSREKSKIRNKILTLRRRQRFLIKKKHDLAIMRRLEKMEVFKKAKNIFTYNSLPDEVSTDFLAEFSVRPQSKRGKRILTPKKPGGGREKLLKQFSKMKFDLCIVPGVAFDKTGHRIGFGGGYFDRLLKKTRAATIGLAYEFQIIDKVPVTAYDVAVDYIVTEKRVIRCQQFKNKIRRSLKS